MAVIAPGDLMMILASDHRQIRTAARPPSEAAERHVLPDSVNADIYAAELLVKPATQSMQLKSIAAEKVCSAGSCCRPGKRARCGDAQLPRNGRRGPVEDHARRVPPPYGSLAGWPGRRSADRCLSLHDRRGINGLGRLLRSRQRRRRILLVDAAETHRRIPTGRRVRSHVRS